MKDRLAIQVAKCSAERHAGGGDERAAAARVSAGHDCRASRAAKGSSSSEASATR